MEGNGYYETSDLSIAAFMYMKGLSVRSAKRLPKGSGAGFSFILDDPEGKAKELHLAFANSDCSRYDQALRTIKRLVFD